MLSKVTISNIRFLRPEPMYVSISGFRLPSGDGSRPSATSLRGDGKVGPSGSSPGGRVRGAAGE